jgi:Trypsin
MAVRCLAIGVLTLVFGLDAQGAPQRGSALDFQLPTAADVIARFALGKFTRCSGVPFGYRYALTAAHCVAGADLVSVDGQTGLVAAASSSLDVALIAVNIWETRNSIVSSSEGTCRLVVILRRREWRAWSFVFTPVDLYSDGAVLSGGSRGERLPCLGDSGSPLLACDGEDCVLWGILRAGSLQCNGKDIFTSRPAVEKWLNSIGVLNVVKGHTVVN